jgi:alginate O-acetyltransferase complex protein AlgI
VLGLFTYFLVNLTWVFFRAKDFTTAWRVLRGMLGFNATAEAILSTVYLLSVGIIVSSLVATHWYMRDRTLESVVARAPAALVTVLWALMACAIVISQGEGNAFIYFQF